MARIGFKRNQDAINTILLESLNNGETYKTAFCALTAKIPMKQRTFDKYWNMANDLYKTEALRIRDELLCRNAKDKLIRLRSMPMCKELIVKSLQVMMDDVQVSDQNRIKAMQVISELEGYYAPANQQVTFINPPPIFGVNPLIDGCIDISHQEVQSDE